jgi:hypothetical protein
MEAEIIDRITTRFSGEAVFPVSGDEKFFDIGYGGVFSADFLLYPKVLPFFYAETLSAPIKNLDSLSVTAGGFGAGILYSPADRLRLRLDGYGGLYSAVWRDLSAGGFSLGIRGEAGFRISPSLTVSANAGLSRYLGASDPFLTAARAGLSISYNLGGLGQDKSRLYFDDVRLDTVFPVFHSYYDDNSFGSVKLRNHEEVSIKDVRVSFSLGRYMAQPKLCAAYAELPRGASVEVPVLAIFNDEVLSLTENSRVQGEVIVDYRILGSSRQTRMPVVLRLHHRNAMTWDDDRKAAVFVSPTDPAVLWFSRYVTAAVRERLRGDINRNLQFAIGIFETMRLYGINYVIDPSSSYVEKSAQGSSIDYLQYPHQTLFYRGGDCDDLSILFSALLESVGIKTAFITVPGHIYMAFSLDISEAEAKSSFYDPSLLIFREGKAWVPVEVTMVKEEFIKAWRIGAKQWNDNVKTGTADFYSMAESWKIYKPVGIPDVNPRFFLPEEALTMQAFDTSLDRYVAREIEPLVRDYKNRLALGESPELENELGILFGRYGMLKEAWARFSKSAKAGYAHAWTNLGNVSFLRKDFKLSLSYYEWALKLNPSDEYALLGITRSRYELERFSEASAGFEVLKQRAPQLASRYGYLGSVYGGEGRAWSMADRLLSTVWGRPSETPRLAASPRPVPPAQPAPPASPAAVPMRAAPEAPVTEAPSVSVSAEESPKAETPALSAAFPEKRTEAPLPEVLPVSETAEVRLAAGPESAAPPPESSTVTENAAPPPSPAEPPPTAEASPAAEMPPAAEVQPAADTPPVIAEAPPEDADLRVTSAAAVPMETKNDPAPSAAAPSPPEIADAPPEDADLQVVRTVPGPRAEPPPEIPAAPVQEPAAVAAATPAAAEQESATVASTSPPAEAAQPPGIEAPPEDADLQVVRDVPGPAAEPTPEPAAIATAPSGPAPEIAAVPEPVPEIATAIEPAAAPAEVSVPESVSVAAAPPLPASPRETLPAPLEKAAAEPAATTAAPEPVPEIAAASEPAAAPVEIAAVAEASPASEPVAVPAEAAPETIPAAEESPFIFEGFHNAVPALGSWVFDDYSAAQTDSRQKFSKLVVPVFQDLIPIRYTFDTRSLGSGWVGMGLHIYLGEAKTHRGYGAGKSILLWLTQDPKFPESSRTRLQIYRSLNDVSMRLETEVAVTESPFDVNTLTLEMDPKMDLLTVLLNGEKRLSVDEVQPAEEGFYVIFRTLDKAEFRNFRVEKIWR